MIHKAYLTLIINMSRRKNAFLFIKWNTSRKSVWKDIQQWKARPLWPYGINTYSNYFYYYYPYWIVLFNARKLQRKERKTEISIQGIQSMNLPMKTVSCTWSQFDIDSFRQERIISYLYYIFKIYCNLLLEGSNNESKK